MAYYGGMGITDLSNYSSSSGQTISNNSNSDYSATSDISLAAGSYLLFLCYMPSMTSGEYPNGDEDPHEINYKLNGTWQSVSIEAPESNPQTHIKTSVALWPISSNSAMTVKFGVRKGGSDGDSGGTAGRLHWRITRTGDYE